jgi:hypothetical protein
MMGLVASKDFRDLSLLSRDHAVAIKSSRFRRTERLAEIGRYWKYQRESTAGKVVAMQSHHLGCAVRSFLKCISWQIASKRIHPAQLLSGVLFASPPFGRLKPSQKEDSIIRSKL